MKDKQNEKLDKQISEVLKVDFTEEPDVGVFNRISDYFEESRNDKSVRTSVILNSFYRIAAGFALFLVVTFYSMGYLKESSSKVELNQKLPELYSRASWNIGTSIVQDSLRFVQASMLEIR